jgi:hypothetical protein
MYVDGVVSTRNPYHTVSNHHKSTYLPFNQLGTQFHLFFRKKKQAVQGAFRVDMFIYEIDYSEQQVPLKKAEGEDNHSKRNYRTQLRFDQHNET